MVLASMMGEAMIFVVDSDEAVGQCDDEDMRKLEALAANKNREQAEEETNSSSNSAVEEKPTQSVPAEGKNKGHQQHVIFNCFTHGFSKRNQICINNVAQLEKKMRKLSSQYHLVLQIIVMYAKFYENNWQLRMRVKLIRRQNQPRVMIPIEKTG